MTACGIETLAAPRTPTRPTRPGHSLVTWALAGAAVFLTTSLVFLGRPANLTDETWMLWVGHRVAHGDTLYRDVYFVTTPLAAWISALVSLVAGSHLVVLRLLVSACFTAQVLTALSVAKCCGMGRAGRVTLTLVLLAFGAPFLSFASFYSSLAVLGALVSLRMFLWWHACRGDARCSRRALLLTGCACGASFASKPNIGLLVLAAALIGLLVTSPETSRSARLSDTARVLAGFAAVVGTALVAVLATGAWSDFVGDVFLNKGEYVSAGSSYLDSLDHNVRLFLGTTGDADLFHRIRVVPLIAPFVVIPVVVIAIARADHTSRRLAIALGVFAVSALGSVFPRPGINHFTDVLVFLTAATVATALVAARGSRARHAARLRAGLCVLVALVASVAILISADRARSTVTSGHYDRSSFPHLEAVPVVKTLRPKVRTLRAQLQDLTKGRVFMVRQDAGFRYFTTRTRDPLPFDMPVLSDFGSEGERGVIARLARGEAPWVCVQSSPPTKRAIDFLRPPRVERWVRARFTFVRHLPGCDLYHREEQPGLQS